MRRVACPRTRRPRRLGHSVFELASACAARLPLAERRLSLLSPSLPPPPPPRFFRCCSECCEFTRRKKARALHPRTSRMACPRRLLHPGQSRNRKNRSGSWLAAGTWAAWLAIIGRSDLRRKWFEACLAREAVSSQQFECSTEPCAARDACGRTEDTPPQTQLVGIICTPQEKVQRWP